MWSTHKPSVVNFVVLELFTCHLLMGIFDYRHAHSACGGLYLAGHGSSVPDTSGDEDDGNDEALVPVDFGEAGLINDDEIFTEACSLIVLFRY